jgi:hypothetical protein
MSEVEYMGHAAAVRPEKQDGSAGALGAPVGGGWMKATIVGYPHGRDERPFWAVLAYAKVGRKYVHYFHRDAEPGRHSVHTVELDKCVVYPGWNEHLVSAVEAFHSQYLAWERAYDEFRRRAWAEEDAEATRRLHARAERWLAENPRPMLRLPEPPGGV